METAAAPARSDTRSKLAIGLVCVVLAAMGCLVVRGGNWFLAVFPALAIAGLLRRVRWGRRLAVALLWLLLLGGVGSVFPQGEYDEITGSSPRPIEVTVALFVACVAFALLGLHLLGRYNKEFRADWL